MTVGDVTITITHTSYRSSSTDGVPRVTGVGCHVGGCSVWDHSIRQWTQCGAGSCGGWGLILDIDNNYSQHSLKVTHLLSTCASATATLFTKILTQQCSPSGLKCVGPQSRTTAPGAPVEISSLPVATTPMFRFRGTDVPSGNCHTTPPVFEV